MRNPYDAIGRIGLLLAIVGAVNWLLVGLFEWNLIQWIFTQSGTQTVDSTGERIVYIVVGAGGLLAVPMLAATLARRRSRSVGHEEQRGSARFVETDDTAFYLGAPKRSRESSPEPQPLRIVEPIGAPQNDATASPTGSPSSATRFTDASLRYGTVEETDEGFEEALQEQRRAAA